MMNKTDDMISGMLNQVAGRKGCGWLKNECYDVIEENRFLWEKLFGIAFYSEKERPRYGEHWEEHTDNHWILPQMARWFDIADKPDEEEYYLKHAHLALQIFSFGIYAGAVINGKEITPIVDPELYDEKNYKEYVKDQDRINDEYEKKYGKIN